MFASLVKRNVRGKGETMLVRCILFLSLGLVWCPYAWGLQESAAAGYVSAIQGEVNVVNPAADFI
jgi:hypothetical protein